MRHRIPDEKFAELEFPDNTDKAVGVHEEVYEEAKRAREVEFEHLKEFTWYGMHMPTIKTIVEKLRARAAVIREALVVVYGEIGDHAAKAFEDEATRVEEMMSDAVTDNELKHVLNLPPHPRNQMTKEEWKAEEERAQAAWQKEHPNGFPVTVRDAQKRNLAEAQRRERAEKRGD